ncbi:hypothetical protein Tco_0785902 [Tanacetum coccineum]
MAVGGNIMRKTPQEAYDLIENMTQHHFQWDAEVYYDTTTGVCTYYSETTSMLSAQIEVLGKQITYISQNLQHEQGPGHPNTVEYTYSNESDEDEALEADKSEIDPLIRESTDTFLMGDEDIELNSHEDIDDLVPIPRNEESDESETETIMEDVQIHSSQSTAQIPPPIPSNESKGGEFKKVKEIPEVEIRLVFADGLLSLSQLFKGPMANSAAIIIKPNFDSEDI